MLSCKHILFICSSVCSYSMALSSMSSLNVHSCDKVPFCNELLPSMLSYITEFWFQSGRFNYVYVKLNTKPQIALQESF